MAIVVGSFAEANAAEVETKDGDAEGGEGLHGVIDDLVVHCAAAGGMRMADQRRVRGVVASSVE